MLLSPLYRYLSSLSLLLFVQASIAALPLNENVSFIGSENGYVTGFIDADGLPNCRTICGSEELEGIKNGDNRDWKYTPGDSDAYINQVLWLTLILSLALAASRFCRGRKM